MRNTILAFTTLLFSLGVGAEEGKPKPVNELSQAYKRELLFLSTYKKELESKMMSLQQSTNEKLKAAQDQFSSFEKKWIQLQNLNESRERDLADFEADMESRDENRSLINTILKQAQETNGKKTSETSVNPPLEEQLRTVLASSLESLKKSDGLSKKVGTFFSKSGEQKEGLILSLGSVAKFARVGETVASLYPTGGGAFKVYSWLSSSAADSLNQFQLPQTLDFFLFENAEKEFTMKKGKTWLSVVQSGGVIGWIIVAMGLLALAMSAFRFYLLHRSRCRDESDLKQVIQKIDSNNIEEAQSILLLKSNSIHRVVGKTLALLRREPTKVEDAIVEGILEESRTIDRFGVFILVIASVAPLMGLLGTVTGMISTFDIITLYGTGNPKLLSGGISEALVTTMLGLIVAIPSLMIGQYLSSMNEDIKSDMERWSLAVCNAFKNRQARS